MKQPISPYTISSILILTTLTLGFQCMKPPPEDKALETPSRLDDEMQNIPEERPMMAENIALGIPLASGDVDNDGDIDLFVVSEGKLTNQNTLYVNRGGSFSATFPTGDTPLFESGPLLVDYDGDGLLDIIMGAAAPPTPRMTG